MEPFACSRVDTIAFMKSFIMQMNYMPHPGNSILLLWNLAVIEHFATLRDEYITVLLKKVC